MRTQEQLAGEAHRHARTAASALIDRLEAILDSDFVGGSSVSTAAVARDAIAVVVESAFLMGAAAARVDAYHLHVGYCDCVDCDCTCHNDGSTWDHEEDACHCKRCDCACHRED